MRRRVKQLLVRSLTRKESADVQTTRKDSDLADEKPRALPSKDGWRSQVTPSGLRYYIHEPSGAAYIVPLSRTYKPPLRASDPTPGTHLLLTLWALQQLEAPSPCRQTWLDLLGWVMLRKLETSKTARGHRTVLFRYLPQICPKILLPTLHALKMPAVPDTGQNDLSFVTADKAFAAIHILQSGEVKLIRREGNRERGLVCPFSHVNLMLTQWRVEQNVETSQAAEELLLDEIPKYSELEFEELNVQFTMQRPSSSEHVNQRAAAVCAKAYEVGGPFAVPSISDEYKDRSERRILALAQLVMTMFPGEVSRYLINDVDGKRRILEIRFLDHQIQLSNFHDLFVEESAVRHLRHPFSVTTAKRPPLFCVRWPRQTNASNKSRQFIRPNSSARITVTASISPGWNALETAMPCPFEVTDTLKNLPDFLVWACSHTLPNTSCEMWIYSPSGKAPQGYPEVMGSAYFMLHDLRWSCEVGDAEDEEVDVLMLVSTALKDNLRIIMAELDSLCWLFCSAFDDLPSAEPTRVQRLLFEIAGDTQQQPPSDATVTSWLRDQHRNFSVGVSVGSSLMTTDIAVLPHGAIEITDDLPDQWPDTNVPISGFYLRLTLCRKIVFTFTPTTYSKRAQPHEPLLTSLPCLHIDDAEALATSHYWLQSLWQRFGLPATALGDGCATRILQFTPAAHRGTGYAHKGLRLTTPSVPVEALVTIFQSNSIWAALSSQVGLVVVHPDWLGASCRNLAVIGPSGIDAPHGFDGPVISAIAQMTQGAGNAKGRAKSLQMHNGCVLCRTHTNDVLALVPFRLRLDADFPCDSDPFWLKKFIHPTDVEQVNGFIHEAFRDLTERSALGFVLYRIWSKDDFFSGDCCRLSAERPAWPFEISSRLLGDFDALDFRSDDMDLLWSGIIACGSEEAKAVPDVLTPEHKAKIILTLVPASLGSHVRTLADWDGLRIRNLRHDLISLLTALLLRRIGVHNSRIVIPFLLEDRFGDLASLLVPFFWLEWAAFCSRSTGGTAKAYAKSLGWPLQSVNLTTYSHSFLDSVTKNLTGERLSIVKWLFARLARISFRGCQLTASVPFPSRDFIESSPVEGVRRLLESFKIDVDILRMVLPVHSRFEDQPRLIELLSLESKDARNSVYASSLPWAVLACLASVMTFLAKRQVGHLGDWAKGRLQLVSWLALIAREARAETPPLKVALKLNLMFISLAEKNVASFATAGQEAAALLMQMDPSCDAARLPFVVVEPLLKLLYLSLSSLNYAAYYAEDEELSTVFSHLCRVVRAKLRPLDDPSSLGEPSAILSLPVGPPELVPSAQGCNSSTDGKLSEFDVLSEKWVPADVLRPSGAPIADESSEAAILLFNILNDGIVGEVLSSLRALIRHPWPILTQSQSEGTTSLTYLREAYATSANQRELWVFGNNAASGCLGHGCPKTYKHDTALVEFDQTLAKENELLRSVGEDVAIAPAPQPCLAIHAQHEALAVACGEFHSVLQTRDSHLVLMGSSRNGQLGFDVEQMHDLVCEPGQPAPRPLDHLVPFTTRQKSMESLMRHDLLLSKKAARLSAVSDEHSEASFHLPWSFLRPAALTVWAAADAKEGYRPLKVAQVGCSSQETLLVTSRGDLVEFGTGDQTVTFLQMAEPIVQLSCGTLHCALLTKSGGLLLRGLNDGSQLGPLNNPPVVSESVDLSRRSRESLGSSQRGSGSVEGVTTALKVWTGLIVVAAELTASHTPQLLLSLLQRHLRACEHMQSGSRRRKAKERQHADVWLSTEVGRLFASVSGGVGKTIESGNSVFEVLRWESVACGEAHTLALASHHGKLVLAWGQSEMRQLGANQHCMVRLESSSDIEQCLSQFSMSPRLSPAVFAAPNAVAVRAGGTNSAMILRDGTVKVWGANDAGNLGPLGSSGLIEKPTTLVCEKSGAPCVVSDVILGLTTASTLLIQRDGTAKRLGCAMLNNRSSVWKVPRTWEFSLPRNWNALKRHFQQTQHDATQTVPLRLTARCGSVGMNHFALICIRNLARPSATLPLVGQISVTSPIQNKEDAVAELALAGPQAAPTRVAVSNLKTQPFGSSPLRPEKRQIVRPPASPPPPATRTAPLPVEPLPEVKPGSKVLHQVGATGLQGLTLMSEMLIKNVVEKGLQGVDLWLGDLDAQPSAPPPPVQRRKTDAVPGVKALVRKASLPNFEEAQQGSPAGEWSSEAWNSLSAKLAAVGPGLRARRAMRDTPPMQTSPEPAPSARSSHRPVLQQSPSRRRVRASSTTYVPRDSSPSSTASPCPVFNQSMYLRPPTFIQAASSSHSASSRSSPMWSAKRPPLCQWQPPPNEMPMRPPNLVATSWRPSLTKRFVVSSAETVGTVEHITKVSDGP